MKIAIQGHPNRGKEVIQILENLGGINGHSLSGTCSTSFYYVNKNNYIKDAGESLCNYTLYTLEEFKRKFPFKVGDRVISLTTGLIGTITKFSENGIYHFKYDNGMCSFTVAKYLEPYKEMKEERNITLTLDKAKEWYKKGGELKEVALQAYSKEELIESKLPKTWEEFCKNYPMKNGECYINSCCDISMTSECIEGRDIEMDKNVCPSKQSAEAHLAMIQLEQLRNCWWNGWEPIWDRSEKWCIRLWGNAFDIGITTNVTRFLTFPTKEMAREFLKCFRDLIETAKYLI